MKPMPLFIECVENDVTLGGICNTLRGVWGEYVAEGFQFCAHPSYHSLRSGTMSPRDGGGRRVRV